MSVLKFSRLNVYAARRCRSSESYGIVSAHSIHHNPETKEKRHSRMKRLCRYFRDYEIPKLHPPFGGPPSSMSKKASQSFASADAKALLYVFCRDMCVAENTLRGVSVELSAISGQQRRRTQRSFFDRFNIYTPGCPACVPRPQARRRGGPL